MLGLNLKPSLENQIKLNPDIKLNPRLGFISSFRLCVTMLG